MPATSIDSTRADLLAQRREAVLDLAYSYDERLRPLVQAHLDGFVEMMTDCEDGRGWGRAAGSYRGDDSLGPIERATAVWAAASDAWLTHLLDGCPRPPTCGRCVELREAHDSAYRALGLVDERGVGT